MLVGLLPRLAGAQQFSLQGSAIQTGPVTYRLTPDAGNSAGMATNYYPLDLTTNFTLNFELNFGTKDANGADGIAFMLSNTCNPVLVTGQGLGVANTPNSLVVDFDTWDNGTVYNDIPSDHSGIYANGNFSVAGNIMDGTTVPVCLLPSCGNVEDGTWYNASIQWEYLSPTSQRISVYFNGNLLSTSTQDHIALRFNGNSTVFWSLAASTGGSSNLQQFRVLSANNTFTYCEGESFTLTAPDLGTNYTWTNNSSTSHTATYTATSNTVITCSYVNFCGLSQSVSFTINVTILSAPVISNNGPVCSGSDAVFTLTGTPGYTVSYTVNGGATQTVLLDNTGTGIITIPNVTVNQVLNLTSVTDGTCTKSLNLTSTVTLKQIATPVVSSNSPVCPGSTGTFTVSAPPGYMLTYSINSGAPQTITIGASGSEPVPVSNIISVTDILVSISDDGTGCTIPVLVTDTIRLKPLPQPPALSSNGPVCLKQDAVFTVSGNAGESVSYQLNGGSPQVLNLGPTGTGQVTVPAITSPQDLLLTGITGVNGCMAPLSLNSTVGFIPPVTSVVDLTICQGQSYMGYTNTGVYLDTFPAASTCDSIRTLNLTVIKVAQPKLGPDRVICPGDTIVLNPGSFSTYLWQDGTTQPTYVVTAPGLYSVSVNASCGQLTDEVMVSRGICDIYFPSAFSPNNDGRNDLFKVLTDLKLTQYELKVFDRWGEIIFQTNDQTKGWDGKFKGTTLDAGVYVWMSYFTFNGQKNFRKGTVMLVR